MSAGISMNEFLIYLVSDSIGETAEVLAKAAISQFDTDALILKQFQRIDSEEKISKIVADASEKNAVIFYTLATVELNCRMMMETTYAGVTAVDLLSPGIRAISARFGLKPLNAVGSLRKLDETYFQRMAAVEFAVRYDDGKDPSGFKDADLVILGVSRTSKTPLSMYLAHKNIKVANLPLVPEVPIPQVIYELPKSKLVGLTIRPQNLNEIRTERLKVMGAATCGTNYADPNRLLEELDYAKLIYRRLGCRVLDVTNKAVEETAGNILEIYKEALHE